jgi:SAM-dependent methyltransferase
MTSNRDSNFRPQEQNVNKDVVEAFGREWQTFNHKNVSDADLLEIFNRYFSIFPFDALSSDSVGFDMGCGTGRWARIFASKVGLLNCVDPSVLALEQARMNLKGQRNVRFECASVSDCEIEDGSQDFGYSLGVLHHVPDTLEGLKSCSRMLKKGAPFLLYLYYRFDNKPPWFRGLWVLSDVVRRIISSLPFPAKLVLTHLLAILVYWPLSRLSLLLEKLGVEVANVPLSEYRHRSLYFMRTDSLDRFGTTLEKRFTQSEIEEMLKLAGFISIEFSSEAPYWVALGYRA